MKKEIKLNVVISIIVIVFVLIGTLLNLYYSTNALKQSLTNNYLESNNNYSNKLAEGTEYIIHNLQLTITALANLASKTEFTQEHLDIFYESEKEHFNSIFIADENGVIQLISPHEFQSEDNITIKAGTKIDAKIMERALREKKPFISDTYETASGTLLFLVTAPIFREQKNMGGVMVSTVYLENNNVIDTILGTHAYNDGSFVYAVDRNGRILYHPNREKIFSNASKDPVVKKLLDGKSGFKKVTDAQGDEFFAGFTYIDNLGWGIISLTPASAINGPINDLLINLITQSFTFLVFLLIFASIIVKILTKPLTKLAEYSERSLLNKDISASKDEMLYINSHIYEINQLNRQVKSHLMMLNQELQLDGLSGLANRRNFDATINKWVAQKKPFSLILLDIDNFKQINDHYGHLVGDDVIKFVASILSSFTQNDDVAFRYGGEEFGVLLKGKNELEAFDLAEQIRAKIAETKSPMGRAITISLGVTSYKAHDMYASSIIGRADKGLYVSKENGKNKVSIYEDESD
ncbi:sensor domain-containing diguanylate cyclase [Solibacillus silvestris]|uniref:sensor domain-containing diguanylate cyclase n=1 Tax=Solibacillus silvestris TaxID=76853 RepID=UPI003F7E1115